MDLESLQLEDHKAALATKLMVDTENFKSVILTGQSALQSAILINGGAQLRYSPSSVTSGNPTSRSNL